MYINIISSNILRNKLSKDRQKLQNTVKRNFEIDGEN